MLKKNYVSFERANLLINESSTQKLDKQVHCGEQVNQISVTNTSIVSKQLW